MTKIANGIGQKQLKEIKIDAKFSTCIEKWPIQHQK